MRLIDANALSESIKRGPGTDLQKFFADVCVAAAPTVDAVPVVHAQWIEDGSGIIICPECKRGYNLHAKYTHYCPNCGAMMDGGADHEAD